MFKEINPNIQLSENEKEISKYWDEDNTFKKSIEKNRNNPTFRFYDGPPFPTGSPHYGNLLAGVIKDIVPRYWTMRGYYVERRFGWDVHGLPIEMEVQKLLNLENPTDIEEYGIANFNEACRAQVQTNTENWERITRRIGRWVDFKNDYKTMDISFMESVWWVFKQLWENDLIYQDFKVLPYSWAASTPLSNFEANMDYREVEDPSIFFTLDIRDDFKLAKKGDKLLVWTTTPWCIPGNLAIAVGKDITYVRVKSKKIIYWVAKELVDTLQGYEIIDECFGADLIGARYLPAFDEYEEEYDNNAFTVIHSDDINAISGSGLVSQAPAYGESDFYNLKNADINVIKDPVTMSGKFDSTFEKLEGLFVKDADNLIIKILEQTNSLFSNKTEIHSYPYCWRTGTPLIYKAIPTWFVRVEAIRERMVKLNNDTHWVPGFIGEKRFSNWLENARDWAISRNRYWGSCIPVWINQEDPEDKICIGSIEELEKLANVKISDLHRHFLDDIVIEIDGKKYLRTEEVLDCWFESGAMPYAMQHYPFENKEKFNQEFPADFIAEGLDQTRGWFYTLTVLSVALFDSVAFKNCITTGMILAEDGKKMSKSLKNYPDPEDLLNKYGGDALRAYLINSPVVRGEPLKFSEEGLRLVTRTVILPFWHTFSFFSNYAAADNISFLEIASAPKLQERPFMDRWIISSLQSLIKDVNEKMEGYYLYEVIPPLIEFIDELTNWYVRSNRRRFWKEKGEDDRDKISAFATLHEVLLLFSKTMAPVLPFISETIYQNLSKSNKESVHLQKFPEVKTSLINKKLEEEMEYAKSIIKLGRTIRLELETPNRQPLNELIVITSDKSIIKSLNTTLELIKSELNVKEITIENNEQKWVKLKCKPNYSKLGPKYKNKIKDVTKIISNLTQENILKLNTLKKIEVNGAKLNIDDVYITREPSDSENKYLMSSGNFSINLSTELTNELIEERIAREIVSSIQKKRKESGMKITDRISISLNAEDGLALNAINKYTDYIKKETLCTKLNIVEKDMEDSILDFKIYISIKKTNKKNRTKKV